MRRFTLRQNHASSFIERRLDFCLISKILQESIIKTGVLASFCTDHSPIFFSLQLKDMPTRGKGFWKFNNSLISNDEYVEKMKNQISETLHMLDQDKITDKHLRWEFLKYEIRKFTINFSKKLVKEENKDQNFLEKELKKLEKNLNNLQTNEYYLGCKQKLQNIYTKKVNGIRIRSKCNWYENGEKSTKFFLNLEKYRATQGCLRTIIVNKKEINDSQQINDALYNFYQTLFKEKLSISEECIQSFLDKVSLPKLNENQTLKCEGAITECELLKALTSMDNDKSPGNDGITKEFYIKFWDAVKEPLCASIQQSFIAGELSTSQKQAIIKLIEKKDRDKRFIKNWRPI